MTSKNLFTSLLKGELKRKAWATALMSLGAFFALPVAVLMMISSSPLMDERPEAIINLIRNLTEYLSAQNPIWGTVVMVAATVLGLSAFNYANSKKKVDVYHAIPVKREKLFILNYLCGFLIFLIPYVVCLLASILIVIMQGLGAAVTMDAFIGFLSHIMYFLLIYSTTVFACMLTGNLVVNFLGTMVFFFYGPAAVGLTVAFYEMFFETAYTQFFQKVIFKVSPVFCYGNALSGATSSVSGTLSTITVTLVLIALSVVLYMKRPSEGAGKAMIFKFSKPIIKYALVVFASLGGAIMFRSMMGFNSTGWYVFGAVVILIISHAIIEIIYHLDFKAIFAKKFDLAACGIIVTGISLVFMFDLFGYDTYLPKVDKVVSAGVYMSTIDSYIESYEFDERGNYRNMGRGGELDTTEYIDQKEIESIIAMAQKGIEFNQKIDQATPTRSYSENQMSVTVRYALKNGGTKYRRYTVNILENKEAIDTIISSTTYKKAMYKEIYAMPDNDLLGTYITGGMGESNAMYNGDKRELLLKAYQEDMLTLNVDIMEKEIPIGTIKFITETNSKQLMYDKWENVSEMDKYARIGATQFPIYPSFTQTLEVLKSVGIEIGKPIDIELVSKVEVRLEGKYYEESIIRYKEMGPTATVEEKGYYDGNIQRTYTDKAQIEEILAKGINREIRRYNFVIPVDEEVYADVIVKGKGANSGESTYSLFFRYGEVPQFILDDLNITKLP